MESQNKGYESNLFEGLFIFLTLKRSLHILSHYNFKILQKPQFHEETEIGWTKSFIQYIKPNKHNMHDWNIILSDSERSHPFKHTIETSSWPMALLLPWFQLGPSKSRHHPKYLLLLSSQPFYLHHKLTEMAFSEKLFARRWGNICQTFFLGGGPPFPPSELGKTNI